MSNVDPAQSTDGLARTCRGFRVYAEFRSKGREVIVQESSLATERHVWVFLEGTAAFDLNEEQARTLRDALSAFLESK